MPKSFNAAMLAEEGGAGERPSPPLLPETPKAP